MAVEVVLVMIPKKMVGVRQLAEVLVVVVMALLEAGVFQQAISEK